MDLVLYGVPLSPFVRKADVVLREKGLEFEVETVSVPIPEGYDEINPAKRIPALRDRDISAEGHEGVIPDSSAICLFAERAVPEPSVYPKDAYAFGRALWYEEYADSDFAGVVGMGLFRPIAFPLLTKQEPDLETARETMKEKLPRFLDYFEAQLGSDEYLVENTFSIADIAVVNQLINAELVVGRKPFEPWPGLCGLFDRVSARPSYQPNLAICRKVIPEPVDLG